MSDNIGNTLAQNLREDLVFDLLAGETVKEHLKSLKEEDLKRKYKHWWIVQFFNFLKYANDLDDNNELELGEEHGRNSADSTQKMFELLDDKGYTRTATFVIKSLFDNLDLNIQESDLH